MQSIKWYIPVMIWCFASCGDIPTDAVPIILNEELITGIELTTASGNQFGTLGKPSKGGDAGGKKLPCKTDEANFTIPDLFMLHKPYPNPASYGFTIGFDLPCQLDAQMWAVLPSGQGPLGESVLSQGIFVTYNQNVIWRFKPHTFAPGQHQINVEVPDIRGGYIRVYFKADEILAWRDVGVFNDPCLIPEGLIVDGMTRDHCGQ